MTLWGERGGKIKVVPTKEPLVARTRLRRESDGKVLWEKERFCCERIIQRHPIAAVGPLSTRGGGLVKQVEAKSASVARTVGREAFTKRVREGLCDSNVMPFQIAR